MTGSTILFIFATILMYMKKIIPLILSLAISCQILAQSAEDDDAVNELLITGKYSGHNLVVTNPESEGVFCITDIFVNGKKIDYTENSSSFEIPLDGFLKNETVSVQISHHENCTPLVANASVLIQDREFNVPSFTFNKRTKMLSWDMKDLDSTSNYVLEQFVYGKWMKIKDLGTKAYMMSNTYPPVYNSGNNFFRLKAELTSGKFLVTPSLKVKIQDRKIEPKALKIKKLLEFTDVTHYELIDTSGFFVKGGTAKTVDLSDIAPGDYFLNYDGKQVVIQKK